ncbi:MULTISPECIES: heme biosynthesis protein HemY [Pedobacter]|uniref:TPR repeat-containing protein n=1 Tax=Pedobacter heparinus (strain ATCC 13125 / DSM 2366 / CIP 104194 / JCM 7457 / NBRC 12017 / NCIMB 9290 / NRRL B-14731 / HIM 762-3) TaxID=485917 RepID=C6XWW9_PEDHD|nr:MULTISPECIES: tetratricopeptide repeat protein [Pedobacter]ACU04263.1 TPR repeat-containing protein [Pedobacter heparinus DSM 2366]MBB5440396.1 tetratricopeptide (TPR) repeat protein [Pedobacter sp. AK017]
MQSTRIAKLLEFLQSDPNDPFVLYALATEYNTSNDTEKALEYYLRLTTDHPDYVGTYYHLGKLYEQLQQTEKAIEIYQKGMLAARNKRDMHAFSELQGAYNSAAGLDYEDD